MADAHHGHEHHGPTYGLYMIIAGALAVGTSLSFIVNQAVSAKYLAFALILAVAIVKATLVAMYFMHLKWDWKLLYFLIIPAFILGTMMMVVFLPDVFFGPNHEAQIQFDIAQKVAHP
jgi:cytochrome c oxidase subunit 4